MPDLSFKMGAKDADITTFQTGKYTCVPSARLPVQCVGCCKHNYSSLRVKELLVFRLKTQVVQSLLFTVNILGKNCQCLLLVA